MMWNSKIAMIVTNHDVVLPVVFLSLVYVSSKGSYNTFFHPLAKYPGPLGNRLSNIPYCISILRGRQPFYVLDLHERYGHVVRIAPNELSFNNSESWKDIYGAGHSSSPGCRKAPFYDNFAIGMTSILTERNIAKHRAMRVGIAPAFSDRALKDQEPLVASVVDKLIDRVGAFDNQPVDLIKWFNLVAFEVMGELAFGNSFGGLQGGKVHPWVANVQNSLRAGFLVDIVSRSLLIGIFLILRHFMWLVELVKGVYQNKQFTSEVIHQRLQCGKEKEDFTSSMLAGSKELEYKVSIEQLKAHWSDVINAGSDTTATPLMTSIWFVRSDERLYRALKDEVRDTFSDYVEIDGASTSKLKLLQAICYESLRVCHPLPLGLPRSSPKGGIMILGQFVPEGTVASTHPFAVSMSEANFSHPWAFRPERWFKDIDGSHNHNGDDLAACKPFLTGSRACLGRSLALLEIRTILTKLIYKYDIELVEGRCAKDWHADSKAYLFWTKPDLVVHLTPSGRQRLGLACFGTLRDARGSNNGTNAGLLNLTYIWSNTDRSSVDRHIDLC